MDIKTMERKIDDGLADKYWSAWKTSQYKKGYMEAIDDVKKWVMKSDDKGDALATK